MDRSGGGGTEGNGMGAGYAFLLGQMEQKHFVKSMTGLYPHVIDKEYLQLYGSHACIALCQNQNFCPCNMGGEKGHAHRQGPE